MPVTDNELTAVSKQLGHSLAHLGEYVVTAESCTGGGIAEAITRIAGSSAWFEAGYVTYSNRQKQLQLGVPAHLLNTVGAVSRDVVEAMAKGAQTQSGARYAIAVSGIAGPDGGSEEQPVGTIWLAWADGEKTVCERCQFTGDRQAIRRKTTLAALTGLLRITYGENPG